MEERREYGSRKCHRLYEIMAKQNFGCPDCLPLLGKWNRQRKPDAEEFSNHDTDVLVSTTVIEVGVNVPECHGHADRGLHNVSDWPAASAPAEESDSISVLLEHELLPLRIQRTSKTIRTFEIVPMMDFYIARGFKTVAGEISFGVCR